MSEELKVLKMEGNGSLTAAAVVAALQCVAWLFLNLNKTKEHFANCIYLKKNLEMIIKEEEPSRSSSQIIDEKITAAAQLLKVIFFTSSSTRKRTDH